MTDHAYLFGAKRTPIGSFQGALAHRTAPELGAHAVKAAVDHANIDPDAIDEVFLGCVVSAGVKQAPARQAMRLAGIPDRVGATTINKVCGSGMKATMLACDLIRAESARCVVAGGMESMSNAPSCAQGHPIGSTGSRLIVTLIHALRARGEKSGVASLCIGGGEATAIAIEGV